MRKSQRQIKNMRKGVQTYVAEQKEQGFHVCEILERYVGQLERGEITDVIEDEEDFEGCDFDN